MNSQASFGQWLKKRRKTLDLTQRELAKRIGCAAITLQKIEADQRRPSREMAELLAGCLNVPNNERQNFITFARTGTNEHKLNTIEWGDHLALWKLFSHEPTNLPAQATPLIGRDQDVRSTLKRLLDQNVRLLTLVGPPGVGKTRLAIQIASDLADEFENGAHFISLASINDPNLVPATVAQALGINQVGEQSFDHRLKEYVRDKHMLLLLDNFEQVILSAPFIADLLSTCPWLSLVITSRAPLLIRGEYQYPVVPLELPADSSSEVDAVDLLRYSAVELFLERARAITPDFALAPENAPTIVAICKRLDGLPLAIELAAARTNFASLPALLAQLKGRDVLHTNGLRDVSERHQTLYHAIDWSYALLNRDEQELLARCSVFVDGWALDAVEKIMDDCPPAVVANSLRSLVDNHLVVQQKGGDESRFRLLETIREYAMERLTGKGEVEATYQRHAEYYLALAEEADPHLRTASQQVWLDRLDIERGNFCGALTWLIDIRSDIEKGMRLAGALGWFWNVRSYVSEGRDWLNKTLQRGGEIPSAHRVKVLNAAGSLAWEQGDLIHARIYLEESIFLCRELGPAHTWDLAMALGNYGNVVMYLGDQEALQRAAEEAHLLFSQLKDSWGMGLTLCLIGEVYLLKHNYMRACSYFEEASTQLRKTGDKWAIGVSLMDWGYTNFLMGDLDSTHTHLEESIAMHREIGERFIRSLSLNVLAQVVQQQDAQLAIELYSESLDILRKMGIEGSIADVQYNLACFVHAQGHDQFAKKLYSECLEIFSKQGNETGIAKCQAGLTSIVNLHKTTDREA